MRRLCDLMESTPSLEKSRLGFHGRLDTCRAYSHDCMLYVPTLQNIFLLRYYYAACQMLDHKIHGTLPAVCLDVSTMSIKRVGLGLVYSSGHDN